MLGAVTSSFGWGGLGGKKEEKSKPTTPRTSTPGWGGLGSVPSVTESTGGGGGWGAATGNSAWGSIIGGKSGNASAADLLDGAGTMDHSAQDTVQNGESLSFFPSEGAPAPETFAQEGDMSQEVPGFMGPLTVQTDFAAEPGADTAGPTTAAADSPEVETREGDGGAQGEEETGDKQQPEEDEWALPVKGKKKKGNASAGPGPSPGAAAPATKAGEDEWAPAGGKKKKGKKGR
jgi:hypothetical protein